VWPAPWRAIRLSLRCPVRARNGSRIISSPPAAASKKQPPTRSCAEVVRSPPGEFGARGQPGDRRPFRDAGSERKRSRQPNTQQLAWYVLKSIQNKDLRLVAVLGCDATMPNKYAVGRTIQTAGVAEPVWEPASLAPGWCPSFPRIPASCGVPSSSARDAAEGDGPSGRRAQPRFGTRAVGAGRSDRRATTPT